MWMWMGGVRRGGGRSRRFCRGRGAGWGLRVEGEVEWVERWVLVSRLPLLGWWGWCEAWKMGLCRDLKAVDL